MKYIYIGIQESQGHWVLEWDSFRNGNRVDIYS